jgi:hypothetical protein
MGAKRRRKAPTKRVYATLEIGYYTEMVRMMEQEDKWTDEAAFVRDAVVAPPAAPPPHALRRHAPPYDASGE